MRTMYVPGSETHVHNDYIIGHNHTMLEINSGKVLNYIKMSEKRNVEDKPTQAADWGFATKMN
jgi:hypothetical protein